MDASVSPWNSADVVFARLRPFVLCTCLLIPSTAGARTLRTGRCTPTQVPPFLFRKLLWLLSRLCVHQARELQLPGIRITVVRTRSMSPGENFQLQQQLLRGIANKNIDAMKAALEAGASVDGSPEQPLVPIVVAAIVGRVGTGTGMVNLLLEQGADPDIPATKDMLSPASGKAMANRGERAVHVAARRGRADLVRLLLKAKRSRADPNAPDNRGHTPLMATCRSSLACVEVVQLLLETGADPAVAQKTGLIPLHMAAVNGHTHLVDILCSRSPGTLNRCDSKGQTPLFLACREGHERMASKLLSRGAMQPMPLNGGNVCPLKAAVFKGFVGVVRVLITEGGIRAVGGEIPLTQALFYAVHTGQARVLRLLLKVDGEEARSGWANTPLQGTHMLHDGAICCKPASVSVLLEAGADETARDSEGRIPRDAIGVGIGLEDETQRDRGKNVAIRRMLQRGPAYRARSWAWPSAKKADAGVSGDGDTAPAADAALISCPPSVKPSPEFGVRFFRPKDSSSKFFVRLFGRYCTKD